MEDIIFSPEPIRLIIAASTGILLLLLLIIKFKVNPILSLLVSALFIGLGAGMPVTLLTDTVENGVANTLKGLILLIGLGSMFGGILEVSGGAKCVAQTLVNKFGEKKAGIALGFTGLIVGTTVYFEAAVMILMPLAFNLSKRTKKSSLFYAIPLLSGIAAGFTYIPPSAGPILVANILGVDLGLLIIVAIPTAILSLIFSGILWSKFVSKKYFIAPPTDVEEVVDEANLPKFSTVITIILVPLILIIISTLSNYIALFDPIKPLVTFLGTPFVALIIAIILAMVLLSKKQGYTNEQLKIVLENSLKPTASVILVITGGGIVSEVLQTCGLGDLVGSALEESGLPILIVAFLIAALIRVCVGVSVIPMAVTAGIMVSMPAVASLSPLYLVALVLAINGGATVLSHVNDSGFWLVSSLLRMDEKTALKTWTIMVTILGLTGLACALILASFA